MDSAVVEVAPFAGAVGVAPSAGGAVDIAYTYVVDLKQDVAGD